MADAPIVTIFGGSGFIGRYVAQRMARAGWRVRVAVRRPNDAIFVRTYGVVGQVEAIQANIRDEASTEAAIAGADAVVNATSVPVELGKQNFDTIQLDGATRVARLCAKHGISRLVHISAIGAREDSPSRYAQTKAMGDAAIMEAVPSALILRSSVIFGNEDGFFNKFAQMAKMSPFIPLVGAKTKFQPVYVGDVAQAVETGILQGMSGVYELGGPDVESFRALIRRMLHVIRRKRVILPLPSFIAGIMGGALNLVQFLSGGLLPNTTITPDQVKMLADDNVVGKGNRGLAAFGITPTPMDVVIESYLYSYRPYGQYTELTDSAQG